MLHYILQTIAFQVFFLIVYDLFLKNETFFNWNRVYLIGTAFLSFSLPFLKFESIKAIVPEPMVIRLPEVIIGEVSPVMIDNSLMVPTEQITEQALSFSWMHVWSIGMVFAALFFAYKMGKILRILYKNPKRWQGNIVLVTLLNSSAAFSFFHYIFLGTNIQAERKAHIVQHELVHVKEKHSVDLLLFEIFRIVFWFNPLIYMYQNRLSTLHEFIADAKAVEHNGKSEYYQNLLSQVFETEHISFINPFFHQSLIKKRIIMLSKSKSKQIHLIKYALLVPVVTLMLMYTSSYASAVKDPFPIFQNENLGQELTFQQLVDKYYNEIEELSKSKSKTSNVLQNYLITNGTYIESKENLAKMQAFTKFMTLKMKAKKEKEGELKDSDVQLYDNMVKRYETYEDYLSYKKTDAAKRNWESSARHGELRLVVDDMDNLSEVEQKLKDEKMALIKNDPFYHTLVMTDGKMTASLDFGKKEKKVQGKTSESYGGEVPFAVIDEVPLFQGCEASGSKEDDKICTSNKVSEFVNRNFNTNIATENHLKGRQRISVIFKIGEDGKVKDIMARAPHPALEKEAIRVIESMPDFTPGKQKGIAVTVPYSLPILFQVVDDTPEGDKEATDNFEENINLKLLNLKKQVNDLIKIEVPYHSVDEAPVFSTCEVLESNNARKTCTSDKIMGFVNENFNTKLAKELGLTGRQRISVVFKIGEDGVISNIQARAPHPGLEKEAVRVIGALPKMQPGMHNGKPVIVPYSLPILFNVE